VCPEQCIEHRGAEAQGCCAQQQIAPPEDAAPAEPDSKAKEPKHEPKKKAEPRVKAEPKAEADVPNAAEEGSDAETGSDDDHNATRPRTAPKATNQSIGLAATATPKQISDVAKKAEAKGDWDAARLAYERLEQAKGYQYPGYAVYKQAYAAYKAKDTADALTLAQRASSINGNQKVDAKLLYADALIQQGDTTRAKQFLIGLRKQTDDKKKKQLVADKITECNKKLGMPAKDGID
jgi:hypothetical protein